MNRIRTDHRWPDLRRHTRFTSLIAAMLLLAACQGGGSSASATDAVESDAPSTSAPPASAGDGGLAGYPSGPIEVIVPFSPGGGADNSQRVFNQYAAELVGEEMVIVNLPGAGGATGWADMVRREPDGQTLAIVTPPFNLIPALTQPDETGYALDDFTYLCVYAIVPDVLYVKADSEFETIEDLIAFSDKNPGDLLVANAGSAGADVLTTLLVENATGIDFTIVPFEGGAESLQATLAGTTQAMIGSSAFVNAQEGELRPLGIASTERDPNFPDLPTFSEQGYDVVAERFRALGGPTGMSQDLVEYWGDICESVVADPEFVAAMDEQGQPAAYLGPEEATAAVQRMAESIEPIVDDLRSME